MIRDCAELRSTRKALRSIYYASRSINLMDDFTSEQLKALTEWEKILRNISDFVLIKEVNGIRFEVYTKEKGSHHILHLHVSTSSASMSISIEDGEIFAKTGKISPPKMKQAQKWMQTNKKLIAEKWTAFSNGFEIPLA